MSPVPQFRGPAPAWEQVHLQGHSAAQHTRPFAMTNAGVSALLKS